MNTNKIADMGIGALAGLALGLVAGILYAPRSGAETRAAIKDRTNSLRGMDGEFEGTGEEELVLVVAEESVPKT